MTSKSHPIPPWATRALITILKTRLNSFDPMKVVWNPCSNMGYMSAALSECFPIVISTDSKKFDYGHGKKNFFKDDFPLKVGPHWVITAPPNGRLKKGEAGSIDDYVLRALEVAQEGVAIFAKTDFLHGVGRHEKLMQSYVPVIYAPFVEPIGLSEDGIGKKGVHKRTYAWFIWVKGVKQVTRMFPIPPCKDILSKDYDADLPSLMPAYKL